MEWPEVNQATGKPKTTPTNQAILLAAAGAAQAALPEQVAAFRELVQNCSNWRSDYKDIFEAFVRLQLEASPEVVDTMCQAGLSHAQDVFCYRINKEEDADKSVSLEEAFGLDYEPLESMVYTGTKKVAGPVPFELASPHGTDSDPLWVTGENAIAQIDAWESYGSMEPSAKEFASEICKQADVSDRVAGKTFCLLGVTSEMGPTKSLLKLPGSYVLGVARSGSKMENLVQWFEKEGAEGSTLELPKEGANMLNQVPQIARWIVDKAPKDREIVLVPLAYMDGEACVRVTIAMDKIMTHVMENRKDVSLVYLISPATVYPIPKEAAEDAQNRYENDSMSLPSIVSRVSFGNLVEPANTWTEENQVGGHAVLNGLVNLQGPNYALAKTMQQWRCMAAHAAGIPVVAPHAPATRTYSVVHSPEAAAGLEGFNYFPPMLAFDVCPISSLMTAIVLQMLAQSKTGQLMDHPMELFWAGSVHGGIWRAPYNGDSCAAVAYLLGRLVATKGSSPAASLAPEPTTTSAAPDEN